MKRIFILAALLLTGICANAQIDNFLGDWKTIDDKLKKEVSVVNIFQGDDGLYYGRVEKMLIEGKGDFVGTLVIEKMKYEDGILQGGRVYDPKSEKTYYGTVKYDAEKNQLILRGSLDKKGVLGRSQTWVK